MIALYDFFRQVFGVLRLALQVFGNFSVRYKIVAHIDQVAVFVVTIAIDVHWIAEHIHGLSKRERNVVAFRKDLPDETNDLQGIVKIVSGLQKTFFAQRPQIAFNQVRRFQYKVIAQHQRNDEQFLVFALLVQGPLRLHRGAQQTQFQLFFQFTRTRTCSSRKKQTIGPPLQRQVGHRLERFEVNAVLFAPIHPVSPQAVHKIGGVARIVQIEAGAVRKRRQPEDQVQHVPDQN